MVENQDGDMNDCYAGEKVSVIMPAVNSARAVDRAIDSVLAQTHSMWRLIVVDDASTDETVARVEERRRGLGT